MNVSADKDKLLRISIVMAAFVTIMAIFSACEEVINVDLNNAAPTLVIQGSVNNTDHYVTVQLTKTTDYFHPTQIMGVDSALVSLSDDAGNTFPFSYSSNGIYSTSVYPDIVGVQGRTYTLSVQSDGVLYTAKSQMPILVPLDSVTVVPIAGRNNENALNCYIHDPAGIANYYMIRVYRSDTLLNNNNRIILNSDKFYDGLSTYIQVGSERVGIDSFNPSDTLTVQLFSIDQTTYNYFTTLRAITNQSLLSTSTPANPSNNISNGALGYFAAWSMSQKTFVVQ